MVEATDRPRVAAEDAETYKPLSLFAMAAFGLSVLYAFAVLIGGAIALVTRVPMLMPGWSFLFPIAIIVLCWASAKRIRNAEGTLSGLAFTVWGSRLAILCGITYAAYYLATFFAIRGPAINCANDFFRKIKDGEIEQAFLMSLDVSTKGMDSKGLRDMIESRFNQPMGTTLTAPGPYTRFRQENFVRFIQMDGDKAQITPTGVSLWEYGKGGYEVILTYHVATSLIEFDMKVETFGREPKPGEPKGLKWQVFLTRGQTNMISDSMRLTPEGKDTEAKTGKAIGCAAEWAAQANEPDALAPADRARFAKMIRIDDKTFWASRQLRSDIIERIRNTFQPSAAGKKSAFSLTLQPNHVPLLHDSDGRTTVLVDVALRYIDEDGMKPQYMVDGQLAVSAKSSEATESQSAWRVEALEFLSGRTPPERRRPPGEKGPPPSPPPQRQS